MGALNNHNKSHTKPFGCIKCTYRGRDIKNLKSHIINSHILNGHKPYKCAYCEYLSAEKGNVQKHITVQHPGEQRQVLNVGEYPNVKKIDETNADTWK